MSENEFKGRVGVQQLSKGTTGSVRLNAEGAMVTQNIAGKYAEAAKEGRLFAVANQAAAATTAALTTTWKGLGVCNPVGSGKNLIIHEFGWALTVVGPDEGGVGLMLADDTGMEDSLTARAGMYGRGSSVAYCDAEATIGTPVLERMYGTYGTGAISTAMLYAPTMVVLDGSIILPPDRSVLTYTTTACTAAFVFYFLWEEVDE